MIKQKVAFVLIVAIAFLAMAGGAEANSRSELSVQVDTSGPTIVSYTISNHTITPPQITEIDVEFSEYVKAWIIIEDSEGNTVNRLYYNSNVKNPYGKSWNGTYKNGTRVPDGDYTVNVTGTNTTTNKSVTDTSKVITVTTGEGAPIIVSYTISNHTITPPQTTAIDVKFSENVSYKIVIENTTGTIYEWSGNTTDPLAKVWNGTYESDGTDVPAGDYSVNVTGTNTTTNKSVTDTSKVITVTTGVAPTIVSYTISNHTITPPQTTEIDVEFSEYVKARITIEDSERNSVKELYYKSNVKNPYGKSWNGTYENGTQVPDGDYYVNVTGTNTTTEAYVINNTEIITVTSAETLKITYYAPVTPVYDDAAATRTFNVTVNQPVNVSWQINGTEVQLNETVTEAAYTNQSAANGTWNVSAVVSNANDTAIQTWLWHVGVNQQPIAAFSYSPGNPLINQTVTFNASDSTDQDGNITNYEWDFGDEGNITNTTEPITNHTYASAGTFTVNLTVTDDEGATNTTSKTITVSEGLVFDTGTGTYPSIAGTHNGTITTNVTINVSKLYTYPCAGTGGHTEHVIIRNESGVIIAEADWDGYQVDEHNISFDDSFRLVANETYSYTIRTGSYPQIIHATNKTVACGTITCDTFVDVNGKEYKDWIPAIRLGN